MDARNLRRAGFIGAVSLLGLTVLAGCGTQSAASPPASTKPVGKSGTTPHVGGTLSTIGGPNGTWVNESNPYMPGNQDNPATWIIYEPLIQWNSANGKYMPWLATSWSWNRQNTILTLNLRHGVKWSNGRPFTSKDVVFTFNMMKKYPAIDSNGLWTYLKSVTASGQYTVRMTLQKPSAMFFYYMSGTRIVPESIWAHENPMTWTNPHPVGTGPYLLSSFNPETVTMVRNPHYWQAPKPYIEKLTFPAEASNTTTVLALAQNKIQWSGIFSFDLQRSYVDRNPKYNHVSLYPNGLDVLYTNLTHYPFNMPVVRQAISLALNRQAIANIAFSGYSPPVANLTGVTPGMARTWTTPALGREFAAKYNPKAAESMLLKAGFKKSANGTLLTPKGQPFDISIDVPTPYTDFAAASEQIAQQLKQIGINVTLQNNSANVYYNKLQLGQFDIAVCWAPFGANPFFTLFPFMSQSYSAPIGKLANANFERYSNPALQSLGRQFLATNSVAKQVPVVKRMEKIFARQLPVIPLTYRNTPIEYSTQNIGGWPTAANPYWNLNQGGLPVLVNLYQK